MENLEQWLETETFKAFIQSVKETVSLLSDENTAPALLEEKFKEMGSRYNHIIIQFSEANIQELKEIYQYPENIESEMLHLIRQLESLALEKYPKLMEFFLTYRERMKSELEK
jgi:lipopolysaccharide biosynthesis glycosyltransferase